MTCDMNDIMKLFASEIFLKLMDEEQVEFTRYVSAISILIKNKIPFDTAYTPGNRRRNPDFSLTVYITPKTTMTFSFSGLDLADSK